MISSFENDSEKPELAKLDTLIILAFIRGYGLGASDFIFAIDMGNAGTEIVLSLCSSCIYSKLALRFGKENAYYFDLNRASSSAFWSFSV